MNPIITVFSLIGILFMAFVIRLLSLTNIDTASISAPWWVYAIYIGIVFCGVMYIYCRLEDKKKEKSQIEAEGKQILAMYKQNRHRASRENSTNFSNATSEI